MTAKSTSTDLRQRGAGHFLEGSHILVPPEKLMGLRANAREIFASAGLDLPDEAFVFGIHQGYQVFFFYPKPGEDDPPVYLYVEGAERPTQPRWGSFSQFFANEVERHIAIERAIQQAGKHPQP